MLRVLIRNSLLITSFLWLSGCATFQPLTSQQPCKAPKDIQQWHITGSLAAKAEPNRGGSALFDWKQNGEQYNLELYGPFGINRVRLTNSSVTPEALLQQELGWYVPVSYLLYWVRGLPVPNIPIDHIRRVPNGSIAQLTQQGWTVDYLEYTQVGCSQLPKKLFIKHPDLEVRFAIRQWQL